MLTSLVVCVSPEHVIGSIPAATLQILLLCRLKDLNERCPAELKTFYECMDYYR